MNEIVTITRKFDFCAAHRLAVEGWSDEKNFETFGKCSNPKFHGHNYTVWVELRGPVDPVNGMVFNLSDLKKILKSDIEEAFDHRNLNLEVEEFKTLLPSAENIAIVIFNRLRSKLGSLVHKVKLQETPNNFVEYSG